MVSAGTVPGVSSQCTGVETWVIHPCGSRPPNQNPTQAEAEPTSKQNHAEHDCLNKVKLSGIASLAHDSLIVTTNFGRLCQIVTKRTCFRHTGGHFECMRGEIRRARARQRKRLREEFGAVSHHYNASSELFQTKIKATALCCPP